MGESWLPINRLLSQTIVPPMWVFPTKGFDASNLYKMSQSCRSFQKLNALRSELSQTHFGQFLMRSDFMRVAVGG
jgi:hypothetical protein